jgi:hypothetical protein
MKGGNWMDRDASAILEEISKALDAEVEKDIARLRTLDPRQRSALIVSACETAAVIDRGRIAAGLPASQSAPWPPSTWEFLRKHSARG